MCDERPIAVPEFPARTYGSWRSLLEDPEVTIVSIATEPSTHAVFAVEAMEAGKHVIVEKPLALTLKDAHRVMDTALSTGRIATVDQCAPAPPAGDSGRDHRPRRAARPPPDVRPGQPRDRGRHPTKHWFWDEARSGGILVEHGIHFFDLAAPLVGSPSRGIAAIRQVQVDGRTDGRTERRSNHACLGTLLHNLEAAADGREPLVVARKKPRPRWRLPPGN